jgi:adenylate cyclase
VWAELYDRDLDDIFAVQDEIKEHIIDAIEPELLSVEMDRVALVRPEDMEAWDYYLRTAALAPTFGGYADRNGQLVTMDAIERAMELAAKAIVLDPSFADAYTIYSHTNWAYSVALFGHGRDDAARESLRKAFEYARRDRELSPLSATTCSCYVTFLAGWGLPEMVDLRAAIEIQENAVQLNPANAFARAVLGPVYLAVERYEQGRRESRVAKRLSPRDLDLCLFLYIEAANDLGLGDWQSAADAARDAVLMTPLNYDGHAVRIAALYALGDAHQLTAAIARLQAAVPDFDVGLLVDAPLPDSMLPKVAHLLDGQDKPRFRQAVAAILRQGGWQSDN